MNKNSLKRKIGYQLGMTGFTRFSNILRLLPLSLSIHPRYGLRLLLIIVTSVVSAPLRLLESLRYGRVINETKVHEMPIFIVGHWRSGTTHLHNLMIQDANFGFVSMYQSVVPECSLVGGHWLKRILARIIPLKRPMDNMEWPLDAPQEEEFPLAKMMPWGFYVNFLFPSKTRELFRRYVLMDEAPAGVEAEFLHNYLKILKIASLRCGGKRLVLKNPVNTARMTRLLKIFPNARFIHIHRSPYEVFMSTQGLHQNLLTLATLQKINLRTAKETVLILYESMMRRYFAERELVPSGHLVEVRYANLVQNPLGELERIYCQLQLPGFERALPAFTAYTNAQQSYEKNSHQISEADRCLVNEHWRFAFETLGYPLE